MQQGGGWRIKKSSPRPSKQDVVLRNPVLRLGPLRQQPKTINHIGELLEPADGDKWQGNLLDCFTGTRSNTCGEKNGCQQMSLTHINHLASSAGPGKPSKSHGAEVEESKMQQGGGWRIKAATRRWLKNQKSVTQTIKTGCCASKPSPAAGTFELAAKPWGTSANFSNRRMEISNKGISWIASLLGPKLKFPRDR